MLTQAALLKAIKHCDSKQRNLAELIGEKPDKVSYWLNRAKQIPFHQAIAIEMATKGLVSRYDLAPYARVKNKRETSLPDQKTFSELKISQLGAIGISLEKLFVNQRAKKGEGRKCSPLKGKVSALVAREIGFSSRDTYLRVKKVINKGCVQLIAAMDGHVISISNAAAISDLPIEEQEQLLKSNKKEIIAIIRQKKHQKQNKHLKIPFLSLIKEKQLITAEENHELPLRLPLIGILTYCDATGRFPWQPQQLKNTLLPHTELNFNVILEILSGIGLIRKIHLGNRIIGQVLVNNLIRT